MPNKIREAASDLIIPFSFILPISMLYLLDPSSFELVWKGHAPFLIFLWLLFLELALAWKKLPKKLPGIATIAVTTVAPTYLICIFAFALEDEIMELGKLVGAPYLEHGQWILESWAMSTEYVVLTICFVASILLLYKIDGLKIFSVSAFFIGATSCFYMIDTFYPFGTLDALQGFVPALASLVVSILNWMGFKAWMHPEQPLGMSLLSIEGLHDPVAIGWPCAGIQSFFIYTFVILLFIKGAAISLTRKIIYFTIGAIGTFLVNLVRIVSICIIGVHVGPDALRMFHEYYGELYFIAWIIIYLALILYGHKIWSKLSTLKFKLKQSTNYTG